jgi:multidrug efflux system membrane fusion protein
MFMTSPEETRNDQTELTPAAVSRYRRWWVWLIVFCIVAGGIYRYLSTGGKTEPRGTAKQAQKATPPVPVIAIPARTGDMGVYLTGLGNVVPLNTVTVRSRVDGQLMEVRFREGQNVAKGTLLATIDPRPFQVQLTQAEGQMIRDRELLVNARLDLQRYRDLWKQDSIPKQQLDTQDALVRQLEGTVKIDQGQIDSAKLNLVYCRITAPLGGRIGFSLVNPGNIIHASDANGMAVINQVQPITVVFPIPEDSLPQVLDKLKHGKSLTVEAWDREQKLKLAVGTLQTVDNQIDPTTGTVKLKAIFPNKNNELFPNQFVNARLLVETKPDAVVVPSSAIQRGAQGTFVYLVKTDRTIAVRPVSVGVTQGDDVAIGSGLEPGEQVVVDGAERLRDGSKVDVKEPGQGRGKGSEPKQIGGPQGKAPRPKP